MSRRTLASVSALAAMILTFSIPQIASANDCASGSGPELAPGSITPGSVDDGQTSKYKLTVPSGQSGFLHMHMSHGDVDIRVCKSGVEVCYSHNTVLLGDGCALADANVQLPATPVTNEGSLTTWGVPLGAGTYRLDVIHCFSSKDGDGCDYADDLAGEPGALDAAPAIQFVVAFATD